MPHSRLMFFLRSQKLACQSPCFIGEVVIAMSCLPPSPYRLHLPPPPPPWMKGASFHPSRRRQNAVHRTTAADKPLPACGLFFASVCVDKRKRLPSKDKKKVSAAHRVMMISNKLLPPCGLHYTSFSLDKRNLIKSFQQKKNLQCCNDPLRHKI